jgi:hypothetical protein
MRATAVGGAVCLAWWPVFRLLLKVPANSEIQGSLQKKSLQFFAQSAIPLNSQLFARIFAKDENRCISGEHQERKRAKQSQLLAQKGGEN